MNSSINQTIFDRMNQSITSNGLEIPEGKKTYRPQIRSLLPAAVIRLDNQSRAPTLKFQLPIQQHGRRHDDQVRAPIILLRCQVRDKGKSSGSSCPGPFHRPKFHSYCYCTATRANPSRHAGIRADCRAANTGPVWRPEHDKIPQCTKKFSNKKRNFHIYLCAGQGISLRLQLFQGRFVTFWFYRPAQRLPMDTQENRNQLVKKSQNENLKTKNEKKTRKSGQNEGRKTWSLQKINNFKKILMVKFVDLPQKCSQNRPDLSRECSLQKKNQKNFQNKIAAKRKQETTVMKVELTVVLFRFLQFRLQLIHIGGESPRAGAFPLDGRFSRRLGQEHFPVLWR